MPSSGQDLCHQETGEPAGCLCSQLPYQLLTDLADNVQALPPWRCAAAVLSKWQLSAAPSDRGLASLLGLLQVSLRLRLPLCVQAGNRSVPVQRHDCCSQWPGCTAADRLCTVQNPTALLGPAAAADSPPRVARQGSAVAQQQRHQRSPQARVPEQPRPPGQQPAQQPASSPGTENAHASRQPAEAGAQRPVQSKDPSVERARQRSQAEALQIQSDLPNMPSADRQRPSGQLTRRSAPPAKVCPDFKLWLLAQKHS